jgi:hypothetical protein
MSLFNLGFNSKLNLAKVLTIAIGTCFFANAAHAQVFKCSYLDKASRQTKTVYTDEPCTKTSKQTLVEFKPKPQQMAKNTQQNQSPVNQTPVNQPASQETSNAALDNAVTQAVLSKNFELAKSLAVTKEHWRLIAVASQPVPVKAVVEPVQVAANNPCEDATKEFDYTSRVNWRDSDLIAAKKSIMYAACGINEPVQPVIIGQTYGYAPYGYSYGGIRTTHWVPPVAYPQHDRWHHHPNGNNTGGYYGNNQVYGGFDNAYSHQYGGNINNNQYYGNRPPQGLSININSGRFGLQVGGYSQHSSRYSQSSTVFVSGTEQR